MPTRPLAIANAGNWADQLSPRSRRATDLTAALTTLRSEAQTLSANLSTVQIRQDFTKATINTLQNGSAALTLADSNEEGANLLALQTRQQLSTTALSLVGPGRPERVASVPISRPYRRRNGGLRAAVFFRAIQSWLTDFLTRVLTGYQP